MLWVEETELVFERPDTGDESFSPSKYFREGDLLSQSSPGISPSAPEPGIRPWCFDLQPHFFSISAVAPLVAKPSEHSPTFENSESWLQGESKFSLKSHVSPRTS